MYARQLLGDGRTLHDVSLRRRFLSLRQADGGVSIVYLHRVLFIWSLGSGIREAIDRRGPLEASRLSHICVTRDYRKLGHALWTARLLRDLMWSAMLSTLQDVTLK